MSFIALILDGSVFMPTLLIMCPMYVTSVGSVREDTRSDDELFIGVIGTSGNENPKDWNMTLEINDKKVTLKLDTRAQCNTMPLQIYKGLTKDKLTKSSTKLVSYSGHKMKTIGKNIFVVAYKEKLHPVECQVIDQEGIGVRAGGAAAPPDSVNQPFFGQYIKVFRAET